MVLTKEGELFSFGGFDNGVLGLGIAVDNDILAPRPIITIKNVIKIACGNNHNIALVTEKITKTVFGG